MERGKRVVAVLVMVLAVAFVVSGCAKSAGPKDEEAIKVIQSTIESGPKGKDFKPPVVILEKGQKLPSGDWPVKVEYTITGPDGSSKKETATFNLSPTVDSMGANTFTALEAK